MISSDLFASDATAARVFMYSSPEKPGSCEFPAGTTPVALFVRGENAMYENPEGVRIAA